LQVNISAPSPATRSTDTQISSAAAHRGLELDGLGDVDDLTDGE